MRISKYFLPCFLVPLALFLNGCEIKPQTLFSILDPESSGINFQNTIVETPEINVLTYEYTYNGGGVAAADFNNDGLCDLYFTGNMVSNKLYLNRGNLKFNDVTDSAGVAGRSLWKTGVIAADVNGDGWMDIYVCYSGPDVKQALSNQLFINNGVSTKGGKVTFTERAEEFGLDAPDTYSTQASFFDYDLDGDLDMFLINHGNHFYNPFFNTNKLRNSRHPQFGNRLYRNDARVAEGSNLREKNFFSEVSTEAGIHGGGINFSLGISISDMNQDGWPDIFVTNDYEEQDFLYLNNKDGTFTDVTKKSFGHFSKNGMGSDIADFNNDGKPDVVEVDMWPEDNFRQKLLRGPDDFNRYQLMVDSGFHFQQMRNTVQLNTGSGRDGIPLFSEVGQLAGVSSTDWSWAPLFVDVDNDGFKDLFVTNGYLRDFTSNDFLKFTVEDAKKKAKAEGKELKMYELLSQIKSTKTRDYIFRNKGDLTYEDRTTKWGLDVPNLSFGSAYADLDNDGDMELITNNTNEKATVWINNADLNASNNFLKVQLKGTPGNPFGVGTKVFVETKQSTQMQEQFPTRGFQSSVDPILHFGLGENIIVDKIKVVWPDGKEQELLSVNGNKKVELNYEDSRQATLTGDNPQPTILFKDITSTSGIGFVHTENKFVDFDREPLIPYQLSRTGPALAKGDVNGDGSDDFFIGGASGQSDKLFLADGDGHFSLAKTQPWEVDKEKEDTGAIFFDADGDGDLDLFVVSGGNEFPTGSEYLDDRFYLNKDNGDFVKVFSGIVNDHINGSCVTAGDYDQDGDLDLFVGGRSVPGNFPRVTPSAVLKNETNKTTGVIRFSVATKEVNPDLREPGMVTDALWTDFNNDTWPDLILVGEWMPIRIFENRKGKLIEVKNETLKNTTGLWSRISQADLDADGDLDYVIGNAGQNLPWKISFTQPLSLHYSDFNSDGRLDPIISYVKGGKEYPVASRDEMLIQINSLRSKFTSYEKYGLATLTEIFGKEALDKSSVLHIQSTASIILENIGGNNFDLTPLPMAAQISFVNGIIAKDFNRDGKMDLLLAGNYFPWRTEYGRSDAGNGLLLLGNGGLNFKTVSWDHSGFLADGDIRNMILLKGKDNRNFILLGRNNDGLSLFDIVN